MIGTKASNQQMIGSRANMNFINGSSATRASNFAKREFVEQRPKQHSPGLRDGVAVNLYFKGWVA